MTALNTLPLARGLLRSVAGVRREVAGVQRSTLSSHAAFRSSTSGISAPPRVQSPRSGSPSILPRCARPGAKSDGGFVLKLRVCRKRPLGARLLSTQASDADNVAGSKHDDINSGSGSSSANCNCWKCNSPLSCREFFCQCGAAQPLDGRLNYFEMFDCSLSVFLELKEVEKRFKDMQRAFHPDLFASKSPEEQEISAANSAAANKAYQTLVQPMSRVKYLMRLLGSTALEEEGAADDDDDKTPVPMDFLMEIMETRESLEQCSSAVDAEAILSETKDAADDCLRDMDEALRAGGGKDELSDAAVRLRYLYRIEAEALRVMHRLEDGHANPSAG